MDKLGKEYEISRNIKESIFTKRKDLTPEEKAEIYSLQNNKNKLMQKELNI